MGAAELWQIYVISPNLYARMTFLVSRKGWQLEHLQHKVHHLRDCSLFFFLELSLNMNGDNCSSGSRCSSALIWYLLVLRGFLPAPCHPWEAQRNVVLRWCPGSFAEILRASIQQECRLSLSSASLPKTSEKFPSACFPYNSVCSWCFPCHPF